MKCVLTFSTNFVQNLSLSETNSDRYYHKYGDRGSTVLKILCYKSEVAGSIPAGVIGFFIDIKSFRSHYGPGVDSASNRNEYQEYFLGVKGASA